MINFFLSFIRRHALVLLDLGSVDDGDELLSDERSATNEETVDVGLGSKLVSGGRSDRATVDHADALGDVSRDVLGQPVTGPDVSLLSLVGSGGLASADSPDGLVGDDDARPVLLVLDASRKGGHLGGDDLLGLALLTLLKKLTDAEDDVEAVLESSDSLVGQELVSLAKDVTTLAVAEEGPLEAKVNSSGGRELTSEGTSLDVAVLGADVVAGLDVAHDIGDVKSLGSNNNINDFLSGNLVNRLVKISNKLPDRLNSAIALPVTTNKELSHCLT